MTRSTRYEAHESPLEPLASINDLARVLATSRRTIERMRADGKLPPPDILVGSMPRWMPSTIRHWIEEGGRS